MGAIALRTAPQNYGSVTVKCNVSGSFLVPYPRTSQGWNHGSSKNYSSTEGVRSFSLAWREARSLRRRYRRPCFGRDVLPLQLPGMRPFGSEKQYFAM